MLCHYTENDAIAVSNANMPFICIATHKFDLFAAALFLVKSSKQLTCFAIANTCFHEAHCSKKSPDKVTFLLQQP